MTAVLRPVTEITIASSVVFGLVLALLGSLRQSASRSFDLGDGRGALLGVYHLALVPMTVLAGVLVDADGPLRVLIFSSAVTALALIALSYQPAPRQAFGALLLGGLGSAGLCTASVVLMPEAFFPGEQSASVNAGMLFFALGALVSPALSDVLVRTIGYRWMLIALALACLAPAVLAALAALAAPEDLRPASGEPVELSALLSHNSLWLAALVFALYAPLEAMVSSRAVTYLTDRGLRERRAAWLLSGFWAAFLASRLLAAALMHTRYLRPTWDGWVLVVPALLTAVILGNMAGTVGADRAGRGLVLLGFCLGPIFPTLVGMLFSHLAKDDLRCDGTAFGLLFAAGSLGSLAFAPLARAPAKGQTLQAALRVPIFGALLLTAVALVFGLAA
jgi:fucose permease